MKTFYIDFSGYLKIEAKDEQDAESKFWSWVDTVPEDGEFWDDVWDIDNIEPVEDENEE